MLSSIRRVPEKRFQESIFNYDFCHGNLMNSPVNINTLDRKYLYNKDTIFYTKRKFRYNVTIENIYNFYFYSAESKKAFNIAYITHHIKTDNLYKGKFVNFIIDEAYAHVNADIVNNINRIQNIEHTYKGSISGAKKFVFEHMNYEHIKSVKFFLENGSLL